MFKRPIIILIVLCLFSQGCELQDSSEKLNAIDLIGIYVPNHSGTETLQIRDDQVWIRSYIDVDKKLHLDSGLWQFDIAFDNRYNLILDEFFYRHKPWIIKYFLGEEPHQLKDSISKPRMWVTDAYKKKSRIRLIRPDEVPSLYYEKVTIK